MAVRRLTTYRHIPSSSINELQSDSKTDIPGASSAPSVVPLPHSNKKDSRTSRLYNQYSPSCKSQRASISSTVPGSWQPGMS